MESFSKESRPICESHTYIHSIRFLDFEWWRASCWNDFRSLWEQYFRSYIKRTHTYMYDSMVWIFLSLVCNRFMFAHTRKKTRTENQHRMNRHFTRHRQYDDAVFTELTWGALDFDWDESVVRVSFRDHKGHVVLNASTPMVPNFLTCSGDQHNIFNSNSW